MINIGIVKDWAKKNDYLRSSYGSNPNLVIVGEEHKHKKMREQQELFLARLNPKYLLHEGFRACTYNPKTDKTDVKEYTNNPQPDITQALSGNEYLTNWSKQYSIPLIGCDISLNELDQFAKTLPEEFPDKYEEEPPVGMFGTSETFLEGIQTSVIRTGRELGYEDKRVKLHRDKRIGEIIAEQANKTKKSLMAIIGADHMRPASSLHNILKKAKIGYVCIDQTYKRK